ncbi:GNAT family N-acetyltransferase [Pleionea sediminis]|uniref:GNAT family N-acetyltransferase n=1 Tax=Pleionea sediminis TaxID=2569479 RepID=UPI001184CA4D|nr:GNAT family N-acetyltransferase [Pleionea sediminis]
MNEQLNIYQASKADITALAELFNEYRQFYKQADNQEACFEFLSQRFENKESIAFIAELEGAPAGFIHLYPGFSSVYLKQIWTMNDLYVRSNARRMGVGFALLDAAKQMAIESGAILVKLSTEQRNLAAQKVYEAKGYRRDTTFYHYLLPLYENR